jgi:hypothetical protein
MHLFGLIGTLVFIIGFVALVIIGLQKFYALRHQLQAGLIADNVLFYISLTCMVIGSQLFIGGFIGELVSRSASDRNNYQIETEC